MRRDYRAKNPIKYYRINSQIIGLTFRVLDQDGKQIGVLKREEALNLAREKEADMVEIAPQAQPPVVKIIDYKKFLYQLKKKKQEEKKKAIVSQTKEIRLGLFISEHDLEIKLKKAKEFFAENHKVRFVVRFKGREMTKTAIGRDLLSKVIEQLKEVAKVDKEMHMEGRQMIMLTSKLK